MYLVENAQPLFEMHLRLLGGEAGNKLKHPVILWDVDRLQLHFFGLSIDAMYRMYL